MNLLQLIILGAGALAIGFSPRGRNWLLLIVSLAVLYWLQPPLPIRNLDFWLPTASVGLVILVWAAGRPRQEPSGGESAPRRAALGGEDARTLGVVAGFILVLGVSRYLGTPTLTASIPPEFPFVLLALAVLAAAGFLFLILPGRRAAPYLAIAILLALFLLLKQEDLSRIAAGILRTLTNQSVKLAAGDEIRWLGFSYLAFRLIHVLRDGLTGRLPALSLRELLTYAVFFPALSAGPIDRAQRFLPELRADPSAARLSPSMAWEGGVRLAVGAAKKFVLADTLALIALNGTNAEQARSAGWLWLFLYLYAFRIYLDFSGYTDIAIGLGRWMGFRLPENFNRPYGQTNLTMFWNSWHITLAQWFRAYFFNPFTRALRSKGRGLPMGIIILVGQLSTMLLIGLWHGVTLNFAVWGCWHGMGLFIHNRWSEWTRPRLAAWEAEHPRMRRVYSAVMGVVTFQFVALGWVWFALPSLPVSINMFARLFGLPGGTG
jgi:alginate O-acetyltransferase complex protein AlgI